MLSFSLRGIPTPPRDLHLWIHEYTQQDPRTKRSCDKSPGYGTSPQDQTKLSRQVSKVGWIELQFLCSALSIQDPENPAVNSATGSKTHRNPWWVMKLHTARFSLPTLLSSSSSHYMIIPGIAIGVATEASQAAVAYHPSPPPFPFLGVVAQTFPRAGLVSRVP